MELTYLHPARMKVTHLMSIRPKMQARERLKKDKVTLCGVLSSCNVQKQTLPSSCNMFAFSRPNQAHNLTNVFHMKVLSNMLLFLQYFATPLGCQHLVEHVRSLLITPVTPNFLIGKSPPATSKDIGIFITEFQRDLLFMPG